MDRQTFLLCLVPFSIIKKDIPLEVAKYIRNKVVEKKRNS